MPLELDHNLRQAAFQRFQDLLQGDGVRVVQDEAHRDGHRDDVWRVETGHLVSEIAVQVYSQFTPRNIDQLVGGLARLMRSMRNQPVLVVAPWLSPRSRELLIEQGINYLDLTGNVRVRVPRVPIVVQTDGAQRDPHPAQAPRRGLQGKAVNALVRVLVDFTPPYRMSELASASGLSLAYVSRTLDALDEERLIERGSGRAVVDVDWSRLLRERSERYSLLKSNRGRGYIARTGLTALTEALSTLKGMSALPPDPETAYRQFIEHDDDQAIVTGSFAAREYAQIASPTQLAIYVKNMDRFADHHGLMTAERGANVLLLQAGHRSQLERIRLIDGLFHVGPSQLAQDCLSGNGRLPEEGEALLEWMSEHIDEWRSAQLPTM